MKNFDAVKDWLSGKDSTYIINIKNKSKKFKIKFSIRSGKNFMGRFGGGWQWKLGIQAGTTSIVISLLIAELSVSWFGMTKQGREYNEWLVNK